MTDLWSDYDLNRFWSKVDRTTGCWQWTAGGAQGYGHFRRRGCSKLAHRLSWELAHGPVPDGLVLDHLCRNRRCVNPDHLEPVTNGENVLRGETLFARFADRARCPKGHDFDGVKSGFRRCLTCHRENMRRYRAEGGAR